MANVYILWGEVICVVYSINVNLKYMFKINFIKIKLK
jgi:hypothetical protein